MSPDTPLRRNSLVILKSHRPARRLAAAGLVGAACLVSGVTSLPAQTISFGKSVLAGTTMSNPTALQFGPDGRLYMTQQNGVIRIVSVARSGPNAYSVTATETITVIRDMPNHDDDGTLNTGVAGRELTGILVVGTAAQPIIYVVSSDPRIGAGSSGSDSNLDTNSGILSRLTWTGSAWLKEDLVRGFPRSEENHASNGLALNAATGMLFIAQGGHTNMGAPSNNFALLPEYALSAAILSVDLNGLGTIPYDIPTLDDPLPSRTTGTPGVDLNDPFGGDDGANQGKLVAGGPVQVYAPGFRNPYDLVLNRAGRMYTIDNGPNSGWGDVPIGEGGTACTNGVHEPGESLDDNLHFITGPGFYGGHPNPTRANLANTFNGQSPIVTADPVECDYRRPGAEDGALARFGTSTNGLVEYTATNFAGAIDGDLLAASFDNTIYRIKLNAAGTAATLVQSLFSAVGNTPLDVTAQGDAGSFPGTIWVANYGTSAITVYEPADFTSCTGADNPALDEDGDGYNNADEIDNGTNPCSAGDVPPDYDGDHISNLNDPDDDNDGLPDTSDPFAIDPDNGTTTNLPVIYTWDNDAPRPGGLLDLGFTGLMTNGIANYESLFNPGAMTAGGAAGVCTVDAVPDGDAFSTNNNQQYGFQFGLHVTPASGLFTAHTRILAPFAGITPADFQSMGLFLGKGDQDNYMKLVVSANGGVGGIQFAKEIGGTFSSRPQPFVPLPGPQAIDLYLSVDPAVDTVQPAYAVTSGGVTGPITLLGGLEAVPAGWLAGPYGLAIGILSTSTGPAPPFPATWDFIKARPGAALECTNDAGCDDGNPCTTDRCLGGTCSHGFNTNPCDDGIACTGGDVCAAGVCLGSSTCSGGTFCNPGSGLCEIINSDLDNDGLVGAADPCPTQARNLCFGPVAVDSATGKTLRVNANVSAAECSGPKIDCAGTTWNGDFGYNQPDRPATCDLNGGGEACVIGGIVALFGCDNETTEDLFQCEHWDESAAPELSYAFTVPNGSYLVNLFFANTYSGTTAPGSRVFDITIEGQLRYGQFDQVVAAGGSGVAVVRSAIVNVQDGQLNILFGHQVENPAVKAIEVLRQDLDGDGFFAPADCDDTDPTVHPGAADAACNGVDNNCNGQMDEGYLPGPTACGVGACAATGVTSCVAGAVVDSCVPGAPGVEVCDGLDNDCNGITDDAAVPTVIPDMTVTAAGAGAIGIGPLVGLGASAFDIVRGNLPLLTSSHGDFTQSIDRCLADNAAGTGLVDADLPPAGGGFIYIVRAVNCGGGGTWNSGGAGQVGSRDAGISLSGAACP